MTNTKKNILVAPLNWGLGHATRCIPIIKALEQNNYNPIIASDGAALDLLKKEFPHLTALELPSYKIEYAKDGVNLKWKLISSAPKIMKAIKREKKATKEIIETYSLQGIISDNRMGVYSSKVPSVYITHQLNVLSGSTSWLSSKIHQKFIKKFSECWVPDVNENTNLSGDLGHLNDTNLNLKYIGLLSRFEKKELPKKYDLMVLLSGPEPQKTILGNLLKSQIHRFDGNVVFIEGNIEKEQKNIQEKNVNFYNFMTTTELEKTFNESDIVLCRSGYSTIMDLAKLGKKAFFIPTPGQFEQEYLAKKLKKEGFYPTKRQERFRIEYALEAPLYPGLQNKQQPIAWRTLFDVF